MTKEKVPKSYAAAVKILIDSIQTTFGAAILVLIIFGLVLVLLAFGQSDLSSNIRSTMMYWLIFLMFAILVALFILRLCKPVGLSGPSQPITEEVNITDSSVSSS